MKRAQYSPGQRWTRLRRWCRCPRRAWWPQRSGRRRERRARRSGWNRSPPLKPSRRHVRAKVQIWERVQEQQFLSNVWPGLQLLSKCVVALLRGNVSFKRLEDEVKWNETMNSSEFQVESILYKFNWLVETRISFPTFHLLAHQISHVQMQYKNL